MAMPHRCRFVGDVWMTVRRFKGACCVLHPGLFDILFPTSRNFRVLTTFLPDKRKWYEKRINLSYIFLYYIFNSLAFQSDHMPFRNLLPDLQI